MMMMVWMMLKRICYNGLADTGISSYLFLEMSLPFVSCNNVIDSLFLLSPSSTDPIFAFHS